VAPFRTRPNDPISIFNRPLPNKLSRPPEAGSADWIRRVSTVGLPQTACIGGEKLAEGWESRLVAGANVRIWIQEAFKEELNKYEAMVKEVWSAFPEYFTYPLPDNGKPCNEPNPDAAVDLYLVIGNTVDPRREACRSASQSSDCMARGAGEEGITWQTNARNLQGFSGYMLVNIDGRTADQILDTIAHELAHAAQFAYDIQDSPWLSESTATWVACKVVKSLKKKANEEYNLLFLNKSLPHGLAPVFRHLHENLTVDPNRYGAWLFFYSASLDLGDNIVKRVWQSAVNRLEYNFGPKIRVPLRQHVNTG